MPQAATIKSLPHAFRMMKAMQAQGIEWGEDYRPAAAAALKDVLEGRMAAGIDRHLEATDRLAEADRRNGSYRRWLMTELGEIELSVPRTRRWSALAVVRAYARRAPHIDRMILACFVLGLSTRKVAIALLPILGRRISAATVSQVAKTLDTAVAAFHRRPLKDIYPVLMLDGVVLSRKTGAGAIRRPVLVALGLRPDGKKEIIDYRLAVAESAAQWELFLTDLYRRGLEGARLEMICVDGGSGLLAALPMGLSRHPRATLLGAQDQERHGQGPQGRQKGRQGQPPRHHECQHPAPGARRRPPLRRPLASDLSQGRRLPQRRPRRPAHLLPLQHPRRA